MKTPQEINMKKLISTQQAGQKEYSNSTEQVVNKIIDTLKQIKTGWRTALRTQAELDGYKQQLLIACAENGIRDEEQIKQGLAKARQDSSDFFPSVGKFVQWCKESDVHWEHARIEAATKENQLRLEKKKNIDKSVGLKALAELRAKL